MNHVVKSLLVSLLIFSSCKKEDCEDISFLEKYDGVGFKIDNFDGTVYDGSVYQYFFNDDPNKIHSFYTTYELEPQNNYCLSIKEGYNSELDYTVEIVVNQNDNLTLRVTSTNPNRPSYWVWTWNVDSNGNLWGSIDNEIYEITNEKFPANCLRY